ncbi:hypothetical protein PR048_000188 [Dryococelus australis]|uniref:Dopa decarboxylase n=1 Tax=Dryococelus australis TaxID=614101 RepID=A0ABQ9IDZ4_9NEOP|nr:hypothetical protein PR048_000188 [Dryococelus australis]
MLGILADPAAPEAMRTPDVSWRRCCNLLRRASGGCLGKELHLETMAVWCMVKEIGARSYRIQVLHELKAREFAARM